MNALYIMIAPSLPYRHKIGISRNAKKRQKQVTKTVSGPVYKIWVVFPPNAKRLEKTMHRFFAPLNAPIRKRGGKTNGETEWFLTINVITAFVLFVLTPEYWWLSVLPLPFDAVVLATALFIIAWSIRAFILAGILCAVYLFFW